MTGKNLFLFPLLMLSISCTTFLEIASTPNVSIVRHNTLGVTNVSTSTKSDIITPEEYKQLEADPNISIISATMGFDVPYDKYHVTYTQTIIESGPKGYYVIVENIGNDTAFDLQVAIPTNTGTYTIHTDYYFLPGEYDSSAIWFNDASTVVTGSPIVDYSSF